jgi:dCTP deaminase
MFLSKEDIEARTCELFPERKVFDPKLVNEASYDLRVGDEVFLSENQIPTRLSLDSPYVLLPPGQFALVKTLEEIFIPPDLIGLLSIRSRYKFQGLINISGFHVDPTYRGHLIFSVQNVGPNDIRLKFMEPVFMLMWAKLLTPFAGEKRGPGYDRIQLEQMAQLGGPSVTLSKLKTDLDQLSLSVKIYGALAGSALIAIIVAILTKWFNK